MEKDNKQEKDPERFDKASMLELAKIRQALNSLLRDPNMSHDDMYEIVMTAWPPSMLGEADNWLTIIEGSKRDARGNYLKPYDDLAMVDEFKHDVALAWIRQMEYPPNLSKIGGMVLGSQENRIFRAHLVDDIFITNIMSGAVTVIWGPPGTGKTSIMDNEIYVPCKHLIVNDLEAQFVSNVPIKDDKNKMYKRVKKISDAVLHVCEHALVGFEECKIPGFSVFAMDEAQFSRDRQQAASAKNQAQKQFNLIWRKLGVHQVVAYQQDNVPIEIRDFATHWIHCLGRKPHQDLVDLKIPTEGIDFKIRGVLGWKERLDCGMEAYAFETFNPDIFTIDINPTRMMDFVSNQPESDKGTLTENAYRNIIEYIKTHRGEKLDILSDDVIAAFLFRIYNKWRHSPDKYENKVATLAFLGKMVGWNTQKVWREFQALQEKIKLKEIVPMDTDEVIYHVASKEVDAREKGDAG